VAASDWGTALAQVSPEQSERLLKPAPGLEATLWASEPLLVNPTNIDIDARGRVWVAEGLNYRLSRGANQRFARNPAADKIKILEDADGDGKADKVTVFADKIFPVPMGISVEERYDARGAYEGCRVFVGNSPDLLVLEDTDGDDRADKRYPLLSGFGGVDSDHGVHGMVLGLDGKLYFTHGDGCCSVQQDHSERPQNFDVVDKSGRRVRTDQLATTLRANRDGTQFEILCDRQRNNYETSLNSFGNIFTSDNDDDGNRGCRVIWVMDGGHYGYHTPGSPRHWGEEVPGNVPKLVGTGNGSPCGLMVYEGELLPPAYRGAILEADAGTRQVNFFPLVRKGACFRTEYQVFLGSDDPFFRVVDACAAPDGSVFVADWYDAGVGGHAFTDQTSGRIYRIAPKGSRSRKITPDFGTLDGLVTALKSANIATQDVARRLLIERGAEPQVTACVSKLAADDPDPIYRARALWAWHAIAGDSAALAALSEPVHRGEPRIREQAVRILGRDCAGSSRSAGQDRQADSGPRPAERHLAALVAVADDPDAGVRRELVLALRHVPTDQAGDALKKLAASWDGQDRWYLEALGLALENRESPFLKQLFDGTLYGALDLERAGQGADAALPPYFPADRNEAFLAAGTPDSTATPLSKYLGLAWRLHRAEVVPLLTRAMPHLKSPELQQALNDILERMNEPQTAALVAQLALQTADLFQSRELCSLLARRLAADWNSARDEPSVRMLSDRLLSDPERRLDGIALAAGTRDVRYRDLLEVLAQNGSVPEEVRVAAVEALGAIGTASRPVLDRLIETARGKSSSSAVAEAATRASARLGDAHELLTRLLCSREYPLGLRREALATLAQQKAGEERLIELARQGRISDDLKNVAGTLLNTSRKRAIREVAARLIPLPRSTAGRPLPEIGELIRREGDPDKGQAVFFRAGTNSCGGCHRVQGRGQWVGPDLSTIGVKYGREELVRSILSPSAAIGYSFRSVVAALSDGRVITGLPVEDTPGSLVLKTAEGQRFALPAGQIEDRRFSDVSLMPEGLAQALTDAELVDVLAYLSTLRQPVSIVGQYWAIGPLREPPGSRAVKTGSRVDIQAPVPDGRGRQLSWRKVSANAEGLVDLSSFAGGEPSDAVYAFVPMVSPVAQPARLVLDTSASVSVWLGGQAVPLAARNEAQQEPATATVDLPRGSSWLLIRQRGAGRSATAAPLVTTVVADRPVGFNPR
jgi:putative membrane-bound dehydrogenase-like protein